MLRQSGKNKIKAVAIFHIAVHMEMSVATLLMLIAYFSVL